MQTQRAALRRRDALMTRLPRAINASLSVRCRAPLPMSEQAAVFHFQRSDPSSDFPICPPLDAAVAAAQPIADAMLMPDAFR